MKWLGMREFRPSLPPPPRLSQEYNGSVSGVSTSPDPLLAHSAQISPGPGIGAQPALLVIKVLK